MGIQARRYGCDACFCHHAPHLCQTGWRKVFKAHNIRGHSTTDEVLLNIPVDKVGWELRSYSHSYRLMPCCPFVDCMSLCCCFRVSSVEYISMCDREEVMLLAALGVHAISLVANLLLGVLLWSVDEKYSDARLIMFTSALATVFRYVDRAGATSESNVSKSDSQRPMRQLGHCDQQVCPVYVQSQCSQLDPLLFLAGQQLQQCSDASGVCEFDRVHTDAVHVCNIKAVWNHFASHTWRKVGF